MKQTKVFTIKVIGYKTPAGEPTCSLGAEKMCGYLGTTRMGFVEICMHNGGNVPLERKTVTSYLSVKENCPLWGKK